MLATGIMLSVLFLLFDFSLGWLIYLAHYDFTVINME